MMEHNYYQIKGLRYFSLLLKGSFLLFLTGFINDHPPLLIEVNNIIKICLSVFLIYRFNKFRKPAIVFDKLDRVVIYSIGIYILVISFSEIILKTTLYFRSYIIQYKEEIIHYLQKGYKNSSFFTYDSLDNTND
jgi:hypothetical protein